MRRLALLIITLALACVPRFAVAATDLEPYETVVSTVMGVPKEQALVMAWGSSEADSHMAVTALQYDGKPRFEQLCERTYLKTPNGPWVTDLGEAYILAAKAEWSDTGGGGGGHSFGGDDNTGTGNQDQNHTWNDYVSVPVDFIGASDDANMPVKVYDNLDASSFSRVNASEIQANWGGRLYLKSQVLEGWRGLAAGCGGNGNVMGAAFNRDVRDGCFCNFYTYLFLPQNASAVIGYTPNSSGKGGTIQADIGKLKRNQNYTAYSTNFVRRDGKYYLYTTQDFDANSGQNMSSVSVSWYKFGLVESENPNPTDPSGGDDEPDAPTPPEIDPKEYNVYGGDNTDIDVNITIDNDGGYTDFTPITLRLDRIYALLGEIGKDLLDFDLHMQTAFFELGNRLEGLFSAYFGAVGTWLQMIHNRLVDINRNIMELDKSTDDITDLSGVTSYLMQILAVLQGMGNNAPANDPTDLTGILRELGTIEDLLRGIKNPFTPVLPPVVIDDDNPIEKQVTDKGNELARHFPFSIPWDIYGMLALFVADPVAPQFDLPVFGMDDSVHVDLSGWDTVSTVTRSATFVLFALGLALRTKDMIWKD